MKKRILWLSIALIILVAVLLWFRRCPIRYEVVFLPTEIRDIKGITDSGEIVGGGVGSKVNHAFVWSESEGLNDFGTFGFTKATAIGINNAGQIEILVVDPNDKKQALLFDPKTDTTGIVSLASIGKSVSRVLLKVSDSGRFLGETKQYRFLDDPINKYFIEDPQKGRVYLDRFIKLKGWRMGYPIMNNQGWITGDINQIDGYQRRPVLLKPVE